MRINELLIEQEQLDELNLKGLGQGIGKAVGTAAGGIVQGAKNVWSGAKQGYAAGQAALAPSTDPAAADPAATGSTAPATGSGGAVATAPAATPPAGGEAPASPAVDQASKVGVGQINKIIPTLRTRDLNSVKKTVDATLVKKQKQPAAPAPAAAPAKPGAPAAPTQAELDADHERMATGTNESKIVRFESRFLGMMI